MSIVGGVLSFTDTLSPSELVDFARRLEALGHRSLWLPDLLGRELFVLADHLLSRTNRLTVATGIANVYGRDAVSTAQAARTLCELHGGRFALGLGVSHPPVAEMRGHRWIPPVPKLRAYLTEMADAKPRSPAPASDAPVYIAAHGPGLLALAAEKADGANTYLMPPRHTEQARGILGADRSLNVVLPCCLCEDAGLARRIARKALSVYMGLPAYQQRWSRLGFDASDFEAGGSDRLVDALVAWGDEQAIRARIDAHADAGASQVLITPYNATSREMDWALLEALAPTPLPG